VDDEVTVRAEELLAGDPDWCPTIAGTAVQPGAEQLQGISIPDSS